MWLLATLAVMQASAYTHSINGQWLFRYAAGEAQADSICAAGFYRTDYRADGFNRVAVPSCWAVLGYEEPVYREFKTAPHSEGFYRHTFRVPAAMRGQRIKLCFGGVWASAEIWLNGRRVGRHDSGYTSFAYDVSDMLNAEGDNVLAVRVRQVYPGYRCDTYDDWSLGGIYRDVTLVSTPKKRWIDYVRAVTDFDSGYRNADLKLKVMVGDMYKNTLPGNYQSPGKPYKLSVKLADAAGRTVAERDIDVKAHTASNREVAVTMPVEAPEQWNAEHPYLYTLRVALLEDGREAQVHTEKIGFREISTAGGVLKINGKPVKLRGVNHHDEHPDVGRATTPAHWKRDLEMMKAANINYIRAAHYQHAQGFIEMCDSIGMYVGSEVSLGGAGDMMYDPGFTAAVAMRTIETVTRDLNRPSVIYWSIGNEDPFTTLHLQAVKTAKALDGTRPVLLPWNADETLPDDIDILAPHYWTEQEYDSLCATSKRPVISTEYTHAYGEYRFGGLVQRWNAISRHKAGAGAAVWMWADQGIKTPARKPADLKGDLAKTDPYMRMSTAGWDGVVDAYRKPTADYYELKAVYAPVQVVDRLTRVQPDGQVAIKIKNCYDFTPLGAVDICWTLAKDGKTVDSGTLRTDAAPHTETVVTLPTRRLGRPAADVPCCATLVFKDAAGREIGRGAVEITANGTAKADVKKGETPVVTETADAITVKAGKKTYTISRNTGLPVACSAGGKNLFKDMKPAIWHKLNDGDQTIKNRKFASGVSLDRLKPAVRQIKTATVAGGVEIVSSVEYHINDSNTVQAEYRMAFAAGGALAIGYSITPRVQTSMVPLVGLQLTATPQTMPLRWYGMGFGAAWPNKQAAQTIGVWSASGQYGTRAVRWIELGAKRPAVRITVKGGHADGFGYIDREESSAANIRLLSHVLGRAEKGRLKDSGAELFPGQTYSGEITIE